MAKNVTAIRIGLISVIVVWAGLMWGPSVAKRRLGIGVDDMATVVVADRYIPAFTLMKEKMVTIRSMPQQYVPPGAFHSIDDLKGTAGREAYASMVAIPEGQPITRTLVDELGKSRGMASILPVGKVAVSFDVDPVRGAGGWVQPGDTIAIFATTLVNKRGDPSHVTRLLFSTMPVLAVDKNRVGMPPDDHSNAETQANPEPGPTVITVLSYPPDAARLLQAREQGRLSIALRAMGDDAPWVGL